MSNNKERLSFLTNNHNLEQTLENVRRMLDFLSYLNRSETMNDCAKAGVNVILWEVGDALRHLGDIYDFVEKSGKPGIASAIG